jgi:hypothetical protein
MFDQPNRFSNCIGELLGVGDVNGWKTSSCDVFVGSCRKFCEHVLHWNGYRVLKAIHSTNRSFSTTKIFLDNSLDATSMDDFRMDLLCVDFMVLL